MPKPKSDVWEHVIVIGEAGKSGKAAGGMKRMKCKYCEHHYQGGPQRIISHLLGTGGLGVDKCSKVPETVMRALKGKFPAATSSTDECAWIDEETPPCEGSTAAGSTPQSKKARVEAGKQGDLESAWAVERRAKFRIACRKFFYANAIPFNVVKSRYFQHMLKAAGEVGPSVKAPNYETLRVKELKEETGLLKKELKLVTDKWVKYGCTIVCDGWSDTRRRPIINFVATSIYGSIFIRSVDASGLTKTGEYIFHHLKEIIEEVGRVNVVQVVMDNASNCLRAGHMLEEFPNIFFTRCTCHCLDLLFEDIGNLDWVAPVLNLGRKIVTFVTSHQRVLGLFRKVSKVEILRPSATRFGYIYIVLGNLLHVKLSLRRMVVHEEWQHLKSASTQRGKEVEEIILGTSFWEEAQNILTMCAPILVLLRIVDREGATMGFVYELMDRMIERVKKCTTIDPSLVPVIVDLCLERWEMMHSPLHAAAFVLHPQWLDMGQESDAEVDKGWKTVVERYANGDSDMEEKLLDQLHMYRNSHGSFGQHLARKASQREMGIRWWENFGSSAPELQRMAIRILSQGSTASPSERNWSTFSLIHTKRRNRLKPATLDMLVYVHFNLRVLDQIRVRGFGKLEFTLQSIEGEQDADRLHRSELERADREEALEMQGITHSVTDMESAMASTSTRPSSSHGLNFESDIADDEDEDDMEPELEVDEDIGEIPDIGIMSPDEDL